MKKILVIDPIVKLEFQKMVKEYLAAFEKPDLGIEIATVEKGPSSIETFFDESFAFPEILRIVDENKDRVDAIVVNCFADPAVHAARDLVKIPIVGPAEASVSIALLLGQKFGIISTLRNSGPWSEMQVRTIGCLDRLAGATGIDIPVLELNSDPVKTADCLAQAALHLIRDKGAEVIVLGCTGMAKVSQILRQKLEVPVVEPLSAAISMAEVLIRLNLSHSKTGLYLAPNPSSIKGYYWNGKEK
ncbi:MAG: aspartate/glutamate racemase family protein [Coprothermobacterota bacterium]|nr:aspartate/glutamate racemase family protein [Coprothermobacterota bacterium]